MVDARDAYSSLLVVLLSCNSCLVIVLVSCDLLIIPGSIAKGLSVYGD